MGDVPIREGDGMSLQEKIEQLQTQLFTQRPAVAFDAELLEEVIQRAKRVAVTPMSTDADLENYLAASRELDAWL